MVTLFLVETLQFRRGSSTGTTYRYLYLVPVVNSVSGSESKVTYSDDPFLGGGGESCSYIARGLNYSSIAMALGPHAAVGDFVANVVLYTYAIHSLYIRMNAGNSDAYFSNISLLLQFVLLYL